jgi:ATP-dependent Clp protease ATP-binding subunit ClpA
MLPEEMDFGRYTLEARRAIAQSLRNARRSGARSIEADHILVGLGSADVYASKYLGSAGIAPADPGEGGKVERILDGGQDVSTVPFSNDVSALLRSAMHTTTKEGRTKISSADILIEVIRQRRADSSETEAILSSIRTGMARDLRSGTLPLE